MPFKAKAFERFSNAKTSIETQEIGDDVLLEAYKLWSDVLEAYSRCQLSYDEDRLVAISGLVKEMQPLIGDGYVAEFWKAHLTL